MELKEIVIALAEPLAAAQGLSIWGVDIFGTGRLFVRIYVEALPEFSLSDPAVPAQQAEDLDNCDTLAMLASKILDKSIIAENTPIGNALTENIVANALEQVEQHGVDIEQCARLSRTLGLVLEVEDVFTSAYILEVSSPGTDRMFFNLGQMQEYIGYRTELHLHSALPDWSLRKRFAGEIKAVSLKDGTFSIFAEEPKTGETECELAEIPWVLCRKIRLAPLYQEVAKPGKKLGEIPVKVKKISKKKKK